MAKMKIDKIKSDKALVQVEVESRIKRRLKDIADEKNLSVRAIVTLAINDYVDRIDFDHSSPDLVLDRISQLFISNMELVKEVQHLKTLIENKS